MRSSTRRAQRGPGRLPDITRATCDPVARARPTAPCSSAGPASGAVMAANKIAGIRCALGHDVYSAHQSVEHDDANAIAMGAWLVGQATATEVLESFLDALRQRRGHRPAGPQTA